MNILGEWQPTPGGVTVAVTTETLPCGGCGRPTRVVIDGQPGHYICIGAPLDLAAVIAVRVQPGAAPVPTSEVLGIVAAAAPTSTETAEEGEEGAPVRLRLLKALQDDYAPKKWAVREDGKRYLQAPRWRPSQPDCLELVQVVDSWSWKRTFRGAVAVLDRSGSWISAASSVEVAHGELVHADRPGDYTGRPGFYLMPVYPWTEEALPHPLGRVRKGAESVWVPSPRVDLLRQLVREGRWPDVMALDSWTGEMIKLWDWATHVNTLRAAAITGHGRDSEEYDAVKQAFSQACSLMRGMRQAGQRREWPKSPVHRTDWAWAIADQSGVNLWRSADKCVKAGVNPVAMRNVDELLIPAAGLETVVTAGAVKLDPAGIELGTFKVKEAA